MELTGDLLIEAPREQVWLALNDLEVLRASITGCETIERLSPTELQAQLKLKLGPVRARFAGKIVMSEVRADEGCILSFEGTGGAAGFAKGRSSVSLETEDAHTRLRYTAQASIGGKLGQVGGRMIDAAAKQMADQFFTAFQAALAATAASPQAALAVPATRPIVEEQFR